MKTIKGILIDPSTATIREVDVEVDSNNGTLKSMYKHLNCSCVDVGRGGLKYLPSSPDDDIWYDDEAAFLEENPGRFLIPDWVPLIGRGLILGYNAEGDCTSHHLTEKDLATLRATLRFIDKEN